jgi:hypothetical protein
MSYLSHTDVQSYFPFESPKYFNKFQVIFIADSHRPLDVCNIYNDGQIRILNKPEDDEGLLGSYFTNFSESVGGVNGHFSSRLVPVYSNASHAAAVFWWGRDVLALQYQILQTFQLFYYLFEPSRLIVAPAYLYVYVCVQCFKP